jgi:short-subunit dehydrogenase
MMQDEVVVVTGASSGVGRTVARAYGKRRQRVAVLAQVGSALAHRSIPLQSAYCAAKAAIRGFTDSLPMRAA